MLVSSALRSRDEVMRFTARLPDDTVTLLLVASFIIILIGLVDATCDPASATRPRSR